MHSSYVLLYIFICMHFSNNNSCKMDLESLTEVYFNIYTRTQT